MRTRFPILLTAGLLLSACADNAVAPAPLGQDPSPSNPLADNQVADHDIALAIQSKGFARVAVELSVPAAALMPGASPAMVEGVKASIDFVQSQVLSSLPPDAVSETHRFLTIPGMAVTIRSMEALAALRASQSVRRVDMDVGGTGHLGSALLVIDADERHAVGNEGDGVVVAILDTGIDTDHPDLSDDLLGQECFGYNGSAPGVGFCPDGSDRQSGAGSAEDDAGHGTHVSGIVTGKGVVASAGAAPGAGVRSFKVMDDCGFSGCFYSASELTAALDFIIANNGTLGVDIVNMSLGTGTLFAGSCDTSTSWTIAGATAVATLRSMGVLVFVSAGNNSSGTSMPFPACLSDVISVGAVDDSDVVVGFSNSNAITDVFAPGVAVVSDAIGGSTTSASGTSMAAPMTAGCAALLIESGEATTPDAIETRLETSAVSVTDATNGLSFPRVDCGLTGMPAGPVGLATSSVTSTEVALTWPDVPTETQYRVQREVVAGGSGGGGTAFSNIAILGAGTTTYTDATVSAGTSYRYRVRACNANGCGGISNIITVDVPAAGPPAVPQGLDTIYVTPDSVGISWTDVSGETSYRVLRAVVSGGSGGGGDAFVNIASPAAGSTSYKDATVAAGTTYRYTVRACNSNGCSGLSNVITVVVSLAGPPAAPQGLDTIYVTPDSVGISWTDVSGETSYRVLRAVVSGGSGGGGDAFVNIASPAAGSTSYKDATVAAGTTYRYTVRACNSNGCSGLSNVITVVVSLAGPPAAPQGLDTIYVTPDSVGISWTDVSGETSYRVLRAVVSGGSGGGGDAFVNIASPAAGSTSYKDAAVAAGTTYRYTVRACNSNGCSGLSNVITVVVSLAGPPAAPQGLDTIYVTSDSVGISWTDVSGETSYRVLRAVGVNPFVNIASPAAGSTSYKDAAVAASTTYRYTVRACNSNGCSGLSNVITVVVPMASPPAPSTVAATAASPWEVSLSWVDNSSTETKFEIYRDPGTGAGGGAAAELIAEVGPDEVAFLDVDVDQGVTYTYHVVACADALCSDDSNSDGAAPPTTPFNIELVFLGAMSPEERLAFRMAEKKWEEIITADLADFGGSLPDNCSDPALDIVGVDDMVIFAEVGPDDGPGGTLASAGPYYTLSSPSRTLTGCMDFDEADVAGLIAAGTYDEVVAHEMGHVLGIGTFWSASSYDLIESPSLPGCTTTAVCGDPLYTGTHGIDGYVDVAGVGAGTKVPLANTGGSGTRDSHWREDTFGTELMTGFIGPGGSMPLSIMTIKALKDMGYVVDESKADSYSTGSGVNTGPVIELMNDILTGAPPPIPRGN